MTKRQGAAAFAACCVAAWPWRFLATSAGLLWYAYEWGRGDRALDELPIVRAEAGPEKVKPQDPGGLDVPYQDQLVLNRDGESGEGPRVERLLPPPETPLPAPESDLPVAAAEPQAPREVSEVPVPEIGDPDPAVPPEETAPLADLETAGGGDAPPLPPSKPAAAAQMAKAPAAAQVPEPTATPEPAPAAAPQAVPAGSYTLQLASLTNPGAAKAEWARLQSSHPDVLGSRSLVLAPAEIAGVGKVYRLQAGPFASRGKADAACAQLKQQRQDCFVVSP